MSVTGHQNKFCKEIFTLDSETRQFQVVNLHGAQLLTKTLLD